MTVTNNPTGLQQANAFNEAQKPRDKALQQIAALRAISGKDGANLAIADGLRSQANTIEQGVANAYDAIGMLQIADASLKGVEDSASRLAELAVQKNSGILNDSQRQMINSQANALVGSINDSFANAHYNGKNVFQSLDFVVGTGTLENVNLNPLKTADLSVNSLDSITSFIDRVGSLRADIGASIQGLSANINASLQNELSVRKAEGEKLNDDVAKNSIDINTGFLKQNATAFAMAQTKNLNQARIMSLLA